MRVPYYIRIIREIDYQAVPSMRRNKDSDLGGNVEAKAKSNSQNNAKTNSFHLKIKILLAHLAAIEPSWLRRIIVALCGQF